MIDGSIDGRPSVPRRSRGPAGARPRAEPRRAARPARAPRRRGGGRRRALGAGGGSLPRAGARRAAARGGAPPRARPRPRRGLVSRVVSSDAMAVTDTLAAEDRVLRTGAGIVDRSERGKLALTGPEAKAFLHGQVTQDIESLQPGRGCYAAFLTHKGKMLGDLRVLDLGDELLLDTERGALQELFNMIRRYKLGSDVELHKRTLEQGLLSLVGPRARHIAAAETLGAAEHDNARGEIGGNPVVLVATDLGVDVFCAAEHIDGVRGALEAAGAVAVSEAAAEIVRVEHGRPRWGLELDDGVIPQEAGLNQR